MWYECLPSFMLIAGLLTVPAYGAYFINKTVLGNPYRRSMLDRWERRMYTRDYRLSGHPYQTNKNVSIHDQLFFVLKLPPQLLESIPDK